ncbi:MAG: hypothetical protein IPJ98_16105 [Bryobacterales bacterium]|nr:hypothetical protein [Bryobacterales bacterium]
MPLQCNNGILGGMRVGLALAAAFGSFTLLLAFSTGPGPYRTGAPGDGGHCAAGSCHVGAAVRGEGVQVLFANGPYFRPGVKQRVTLLVSGEGTEPGPGVYGFQLSPRLAGGEGSGGGLEGTDGRVWVQCGNGDQKPAGGCGGQGAVEFAQHRLPSPEREWELEWTPPAGGAAIVEFHAAVNAANGNGDNFGDRIYLRSFRVLPAGALTVRQPFGGGSLSPLAWVEIYGSNLAPEGGTAATTVSVGGRPARVSFAGPAQVNALLAAGTPLGEQTLEVRSPSGRVASNVWIAAASPSLYPRPGEVRAGKVAVLYATGCGPLSGPAVAEARLGREVVAATAYATPGFEGLCQFHFTPAVAGEGRDLRVCLRGECSETKLRLDVKPGE